MKALLRIIGTALCILGLLQDAGAENAAPLARADWEEYLQEMRMAAEEYLRNATQGTGDILVNEVGYLQARRYYLQVLLLSPGDPGALGSKRIVEEQLARFRRQHRWQLLRSALVNSFRGSPMTRRLNDGNGLGLGQVSFDVDADLELMEELIPGEQWTLTHHRRDLPFLFQLQAGLGVEETAVSCSSESATDLLAGHASAEIDYTVLPMLRYLLPYIGVGYSGVIGRYDDSGEGGDYFFHGTYWKIGGVLSLGRKLKIAMDYGRSVETYGSEFNFSDDLESLGFESCKDCIDGWTATRISVEFMF